MEEYKIKVYVKVDENNIITQIESSISSSYIDFTNGWTQIDEGNGEKYSHAQNHYLEKKLMDMQARYNYKLVDNKPVELTKEEKEKLFPTQSPLPTKEEILSKELANIKIDNMKKDLVITNALKTISSLKVEVMGLKGGNV